MHVPSTSVCDACAQYVSMRCMSVRQYAMHVPSTSVCDACAQYVSMRCMSVRQYAMHVPSTSVCDACAQYVSMRCMSVRQYAMHVPSTSVCDACQYVSMRCMSVRQYAMHVPSTSVCDACAQYVNMRCMCPVRQYAMHVPSTTKTFCDRKPITSNCLLEYFRVGNSDHPQHNHSSWQARNVKTVQAVFVSRKRCPSGFSDIDHSAQCTGIIEKNSRIHAIILP